MDLYKGPCCTCSDDPSIYCHTIDFSLGTQDNSKRTTQRGENKTVLVGQLCEQHFGTLSKRCQQWHMSPAQASPTTSSCHKTAIIRSHGCYATFYHFYAERPVRRDHRGLIIETDTILPPATIATIAVMWECFDAMVMLYGIQSCLLTENDTRCISKFSVRHVSTKEQSSCKTLRTTHNLPNK